MLASVIHQFDLCNNNAITTINSQYNGPGNYFGGMQLGPDGKIYVARSTNVNLGVINNPNVTGVACNYSDMGPLLLLTGLMQGTNQLGLPGFISNYLKKPVAFTYTSNCQNVSFTAPAQPCAATGPSYTALSWDFGDSSSGMANLSTGFNPTHAYPASGSYNVKLILYYPCSTDTLKIPVTVANSAPALLVTGPFNICNGQSHTYSVSGTGTFSWSNGATGNSVVLSPTFSTIYTITGTDPITGCSSNKTFTVAVSPCTGIAKVNGNNSAFDIYPNPGQHLITFDSPKGGALKVFDLSGKIIMEKPIVAGKNELDVSNLSEGLYLFKFSDGDRESSGRFLKTD